MVDEAEVRGLYEMKVRARRQYRRGVKRMATGPGPCGWGQDGLPMARKRRTAARARVRLARCPQRTVMGKMRRVKL
jgi:hypothetical protein